jgi:hypothetical protein
MTERLRNAIQRIECQNFRGDWHQILYYSLLRDMLDLVTTHSNVRGSVPVRYILSLQEVYAKTEGKLMDCATEAVLKPKGDKGE